MCFGRFIGKYKKVLYVLNYLKDVIVNVLDIDLIFKEVVNYGLIEEEVVLEIFWMLK